jgi:CshA-type fibril repeat protein
VNGLTVFLNARNNSAAIQRRIARTIVSALVLALLQVGVAPARATDPVQPSPSLDLAVGNTTGSYANGSVVRTTTYSDSTTVNIIESKVTVEAFKTTYVDDNWSASPSTYPMGSTLMGVPMWGDGSWNGSFYTSPGFAYTNVKNSWGALFGYSPIKAANFLDTATGTVVQPIATSGISASSTNNRNHGVCTGQLPTTVGTQTICQGLGRITFTFSRPVTNAILNVADLGGNGWYNAVNGNNSTQTRVAVSAQLKVDGTRNPNVTGMRVLTKNSTLRLDTSSAIIENPIQGNTWPDWAEPYAYGSILVEGTYSAITFDVSMSIFWSAQYQSTPIETAAQYATDYFGLSWSLQSLVILPQTYNIGTSNTLTTGAAGTGAVKTSNASFSQASSPAHGTISNFDSVTGAFTYTPNSGFAGTDTFLVNLCAPAPSGPFCVQAQETINVTKPTATHETKTAQVNVPIVFTKLAGSGTTLASPGSFGNLLLSGAGSPCIFDPVNSNCVSTPVTVGEGVFSLDTQTNLVTFTPNSNYVGTATTLKYMVTDNYGDTVTATLTPIYSNTPPAPPTPPAPSVPPVIWPPSASPTEVTALNSVNAIMHMKTSLGSAAIDTTRSVIIDPSTGDEVLTVVIANQGTYSIDRVNSTINFKAIPSFSGKATPISYRFYDRNGLSATSTASPTIIAPPSASPDSVKIPINTVGQLVISPQAGNFATVDATQSCLVDSSLSQCLTNYFVPGQGRWELDRLTNKVTFTPEKDYSGGVRQLKYRIFDNFGQIAESTLDVTIEVAAATNPFTPTKSEKVIAPAAVKPVSLTWAIKRTCKFHQITVRLKTQTMELCDPATGQAYAMKVCTGKDLTPTYTGWFEPTSFVPGFMNGKGNQKMYYSIFFFKRIAIHGSVNVEDGKCSRGCVRVPMELAKKVYAFAKEPNTQIFVRQ